MKLLLVEDVDKLGWLGDVVEVNEGYARNYLLPQGLAKPATNANIRSIADEKAKRSEIRLVERKRLEQACSAVDGAEVVIAAKANEQGHLFGSVSERHIAENLRAQGFTVADEVVRLGEHIKEVGSYKVKLKFHAPIPTDSGTAAEDLIATINVVVVAEGGTTEGTEQGSASEQAEQAPKQVGQTTEQEVDSGQIDSQ